MSRSGARARPALDTRVSIRALAAVVDQVDDLVCICNPRGEIEYVNPAFERHTGYAAAEVIGQSPRLLKSGRHDTAFYRGLWATILRGEAFSEVFLNRKKSGELYYEAKTISVMRDRRGRVIRYVSTGKDVTERMLAAQQLQRLSRARAVMAGCTHVLVHAADELTMLQEMCRIVVEQGGHRSAWIGFAEDDEQKTVTPVASAGIALGEAQNLHLTWADVPRGRGAVGTALRTRRPKTIDDYFAQAEYSAWREFAASHGFRSGVALPLLVDESCTGVLMINSPETRRFDAEEVVLLAELAGDIAFGIQSLRARQKQVQAEQGLRESEERYRKLIEMSPEATLVHADWRIVLANQAVLRLVGAERPEQLLGREMLDLLAPEFRDRARARIERLYQSGTAEPRVESAYLRLDGTRIAVEVSVAPLVHEGRPAAQVIVRDIGDRKRAEEALRESENLFREFAANTPGLYWVREVDSERILYVSPAWEQVTGWPPPPDRKAFFAIIHPEDIDRVAAEARAGSSGGVDHEYRIIRPDGTLRWLCVRTYPVRDDQGEVYRVAGVGEDITERRQTEFALAAKNEVLRDTFENMAQGITLIDRELRLVAWNRRFLDLLEFPESLVHDGATFADFIRHNALRGEYGPGDPEEQVRVRVEIALRFEAHCVERARPNGKVIEIRGAPLPGGGFVTTYTDITDRKRAELALRESEEQLRQLASNIPEAYWIEDVGSERLLYLSPAFVRITGWGIERGGVDAQHLKDIVAPEDHKRVLVAANAAPHGGFDEQYRVVCPDGTRRWVHTRTFPVKDAAGSVYRIAGVMEDITEHKAAEDRLAQIALYDALTNLPNRTLFYKSVQQTVAHAAANDKSGAVLFLDLDRFKNVNDTLGHPVGDDLLREVATRLVRSIRARDMLGRLGGDEFGILLSNLESADDAATVAEKILKALAEPVVLEGQEVFVSASIGIAVFPADGDDADLLIRAADTAMYRAKGAGRNAYRFYTTEMNARARDRLKLEGLLRRAIERCEFLLHYQPKVLIGDSRLCGAEALLRWERPGFGLVSPAEFIPLLEETGLIVPVGEWVIGEVCRQIGAWRDAGLAPVRVAINLSGRQFLQGDLADVVRRSTLAAGIDPSLLEFELTEGTLMSHAEETVGILERLKQAGSALSVDDFGTGYSSLAYLKRFPLDALKIDRSFISDATSNADDAAIVKAIIRMAHELELRVVAEGVETQAQLEFLRKRGCDEIQGYLFSKPLGAEAFADYLRADAQLEVSPEYRVRSCISERQYKT